MTFGANVSDVVNIGASRALDNIAPLTECVWINVAALGATTIYSKGTAFPNRQQFLITATNFSINIGRATSSAVASATATNFTSYALNKWLFICGQADIVTASNNKIWMGDLTTSITEPSAYGSQSVGSGAQGNTTALTAFIGNDFNLNTAPNAQIELVSICNRLLSQADMESLRLNPRLLPGMKFSMRLGDFQGTGTQLDRSGFKQNGTVTGATNSQGPRLQQCVINSGSGRTNINGTDFLY